MDNLFGHTVARLAISLVLFAPAQGWAAGGVEDHMSAFLTRGLPERPSGVTPTGKSLLADYTETSISKREEAVLDALSRGFFPDYLRTMKAVTIKEKGHTLTFWVMPDYLSLGSNDDNVLIPLSFVSARKIVNSWGFVLPTPKMVDAIFGQAECVIWPRIFKPATAMVSVAWLEAHSDVIQSQRFGELDFTRLAAGHKKDIVLSPRLKTQDKKIAIYGWQNIRAGENIQPLSTWHGERYVDYSHGLRLVGAWAMLDGKLTSMKKIMTDPLLSELISREGPIPVDQLLGEPTDASSQP